MATNAINAYAKSSQLGGQPANNNYSNIATNFAKAIQDANAIVTNGATASLSVGAVVSSELERQDRKKRNNPISHLVEETIKSAYDALKKGQDVSSDAIVGKANISDVVTSITNAEIALQSITTIRDKVIAAYQDIIKMQI